MPLGNGEGFWLQGPPANASLLAAIVETAGSVILGLHPDHRIFAWNQAAEQLYQTPRAQAMGMDYVSTFIAPEHRDAVATDIKAVLAGKQTLNFEDDSILPDGRRRTLIWNVSRVLDDAGEAVGIVAVGQDITERKEAEERLRLIFEHTHEGLLLSDASGVIDCNPAALEMLGMREKTELIGRRPAEFSPTRQPDGSLSDAKARAMGALTLKQGEHSFDWVHQRPDGREVPVEVSVRHALLAGRRVSIVSWRDQSRRLELERERAQVQQRLDLAQKMEAVGQLAGGIAHDFNNLLTAIGNAVQLAMHQLPDGGGARDDLEVALQTTERAARLTRQLLAFSRQQSRHVDCIDLAALVREIVPLLRTSLPASIDLRVRAEVDGAGVLADRSQLEQVLLNLVLNARDAMPDGGTLQLSVWTDPVQGKTMLQVTDSGRGMDDATRARIFEPFFSTKPVGTGSGLGLAVVYGVVTQAGGAIQVDTASGRGSSIRIAFPSASLPEETLPPPASAPMGAHDVLLVDDDAVVRRTTRRLLERHGWRVLEAADGEDALAQFRQHRDRIAVLLSDVRMPIMDGVQLVQRIRQIAPGFPAVLLSGFDALEIGQRETVGDVTLLAKPFVTSELLAALGQAVAAV